VFERKAKVIYKPEYQSKLD